MKHTGQYIHFTEEQKLRAGAVDLEYFLLGRGEKLIASGREKRLASDHSITVRGNEWYTAYIPMARQLFQNELTESENHTLKEGNLDEKNLYGMSM